MKRFFSFVLVGLLFGGCSAGAGNKPDTLKWKVYADDQPLAFPAASWNKGSLKFELVKVEATRRYTVIRTESWGLRFHFKVVNLGKVEEDVFAQMAKGSLTLQDGTYIERVIWTASIVKLAPGKEATGMYFSDGTLKEGARPKKLEMDGKQVAVW